MSNVVKKVADPTYLTHQVVRSANTPDYPTADWLINPAGIAALDAAEVPEKYWDVVASDVEEMDAGEKAAVDAAAVVPLSGVAIVASDPTSVAVDANEGTILVHGANLYRKTDDGETTNSEAIPSLGDGQAGGSLLSLPEYTTDPTTPVSDDVWIRNTTGVRRLVMYDGTNKHAAVLTQE